MRGQFVRLSIAAAILLFVSAPSLAQLGTRPADDWIKLLDSPERIASLKIDEIIAALDLRPGAVVADLGAGSGPFEPAFAKAVGPSGKVYAVEVDKDFLPHIEAKAKAAGVANVRTVLGAFTDPKLPAADVDLAFLHDVIHHIADRPEYLKNVVKYLKPGARIAIVDYNPATSPHSADPTLQVSKQQATEWLAALGFAPLKDVALAPDKWFVIYTTARAERVVVEHRNVRLDDAHARAEGRRLLRQPRQ
jgi:SAM-dependent methyltransferase